MLFVDWIGGIRYQQQIAWAMVAFLLVCQRSFFGSNCQIPFAGLSGIVCRTKWFERVS